MNESKENEKTINEDKEVSKQEKKSFGRKV